MDRSEMRRVLTVVAITGIAFGMTYPYVPILARDLGAGAFAAGLIAGANVPTMLAIDAFGTRCIPRIGARKVLVAALVSFGCGSLVAAASTSIALLLCSRLLEGVGLALFMSGGIHLVTRDAPAHARGRAIGRFNACWFFGAAAGPLIGGVLTGLGSGTTGVRIAFAACALVSFASAALVRIALTTHPGVGRPQIVPPPLRAIFGDGRTARAMLLGGQSEAVRDGFMMVVIPLAATDAGLSGTFIGVVLTLMALADVASMHVSGHLADRHGRLWLLVGTLIAAAGVSLLGIGVDDAIGLIAIGVGLGATLGTAWVVPATMVLDLAQDREAAVTGYRLCSDIGLFAGTVGAGALFQLVGATTAFAGMAVALLAAAALTASIGETRPSSPSVRPLEVIP